MHGFQIVRILLGTKIQMASLGIKFVRFIFENTFS